MRISPTFRTALWQLKLYRSSTSGVHHLRGILLILLRASANLATVVLLDIGVCISLGRNSKSPPDTASTDVDKGANVEAIARGTAILEMVENAFAVDVATVDVDFSNVVKIGILVLVFGNLVLKLMCRVVSFTVVVVVGISVATVVNVVVAGTFEVSIVAAREVVDENEVLVVDDEDFEVELTIRGWEVVAIVLGLVKVVVEVVEVGGNVVGWVEFGCIHSNVLLSNFSNVVGKTVNVLVMDLFEVVGLYSINRNPFLD